MLRLPTLSQHRSFPTKHEALPGCIPPRICLQRAFGGDSPHFAIAVNSRNSSIWLVTPEGFEPSTYGLEVRHEAIPEHPDTPLQLFA